MRCLVVTIFYCVNDHFTSFVAILLLLTMVYNEYYMFNTREKQLVMYIGSAISIGFFLNNEYRISENGKILISVHLYKLFPRLLYSDMSRASLVWPDLYFIQGDTDALYIKIEVWPREIIMSIANSLIRYTG